MAFVTNLPVSNIFNITATFGQSGSLWKNGHKGMDLTAPQKTIYSVCDGEVTVVGFDKNGWGRYVSIKPDGFERIRFILCHMVENSVKVKKGDRVNRLTKIGTMGTTGNSTGVHLHVEMRIDNKSVNPSQYLLIPNERLQSLNSANYKFDANCQKTALAAILDAFDKNAALPDISNICSVAANGQTDRISALEKELAAAKNEIAILKSKINNAKSALQ